TEGEKKSLAADQAGFPCLGVPGVWSWQVGRPKASGKPVGPRTLIPDFHAIPLTSRAVTVAFDSDAADNADVRWAEWHLTEALRQRGAAVNVVRIPPGPAGADGKPTKAGLDDFLAAHGSEALREL